jgi:sporulation protein YlmC with PRC-barrel domain
MTTTAIFAAMMALTAPAFAQTAATSNSTAGSTAATETQMRPDQIRAEKFIGSTVYDVQNRDIGKVKDLLFDKSGRVDTAVLDVGAFLGMGGKYVAIPLKDIKMDNNRLTLDMTKEQLKSAHAFKFNNTESTGTSRPPSERNDNSSTRR